MVNTGPDGENDPMHTMHIRFGRGNTGRIEETSKTLDRGETPEPYFERVYRDEEKTRPKTPLLAA